MQSSVKRTTELFKISHETYQNQQLKLGEFDDFQV